MPSACSQYSCSSEFWCRHGSIPPSPASSRHAAALHLCRTRGCRSAAWTRSNGRCFARTGCGCPSASPGTGPTPSPCCRSCDCPAHWENPWAGVGKLHVNPELYSDADLHLKISFCIVCVTNNKAYINLSVYAHPNFPSPESHLYQFDKRKVVLLKRTHHSSDQDGLWEHSFGHVRHCWVHWRSRIRISKLFHRSTSSRPRTQRHLLQSRILSWIVWSGSHSWTGQV